MQPNQCLKAIGLYLIIAFSTLCSMTSYADQTVVNINTATLEQLAEGLSGVGEKKAKAIIQLRDSLGEFDDIEQLLLVKGIGEGILVRNQERIILQEPG